MKKLTKKKPRLMLARLDRQERDVAVSRDSRLGVFLAAWRLDTGRLADLDARAAELRERIRGLEENALPNLLAELGVEKVTAADGTVVEVKEHLTASVSERNAVEAAAILKRIGAADIASVKVEFTFTEASSADMKRLFAWSKESNVPCEHETVINPQTLKAVVRRALEAGQLQPADLRPLGVFAVTKAIVKEAKHHAD